MPKPFNGASAGVSPVSRGNNPHLPSVVVVDTTATDAKDDEASKPVFGGVARSTTPNPIRKLNEELKLAQAEAERKEKEALEVTTSDSMQVMVNFTQFCPPTTARGLFWNWTKAVRTYKNMIFLVHCKEFLPYTA